MITKYGKTMYFKTKLISFRPLNKDHSIDQGGDALPACDTTLNVQMAITILHKSKGLS